MYFWLIFFSNAFDADQKVSRSRDPSNSDTKTTNIDNCSQIRGQITYMQFLSLDKYTNLSHWIAILNIYCNIFIWMKSFSKKNLLFLIFH